MVFGQAGWGQWELSPTYSEDIQVGKDQVIHYLVDVLEKVPIGSLETRDKFRVGLLLLLLIFSCNGALLGQHGISCMDFFHKMPIVLGLFLIFDPMGLPPTGVDFPKFHLKASSAQSGDAED